MGSRAIDFGVETHMHDTCQAYMRALTHGVSKIDAITELADNAMDAGKRVDIRYERSNQKLCVFNDNKPFPITHLRCLLNNAEFHGKKGDNVISKYGVGFKKAVGSLLNPSRPTHTAIITCDGKTAPYGLTWDIWENYSHESSTCHREMSFEDYNLTPFVGTCIIIDNVYLSPYEVDTLKTELAITYSRRAFNGSVLTFNGEMIEPYDPLYAHELGDRINREGLNDYFVNNKVFRVINAEAYHKNDKNKYFSIRLIGMFIPMLTYNSPNRADYIHACENNDLNQGGEFVLYSGRYITRGNGNFTQMVGLGKPQSGAGRMRNSIEFNKAGADVFRVHATKNQGIPNICTNEDLKNYRIKINNRVYNLDQYICKHLWKWTNKMRTCIDNGGFKNVEEITEDMVRAWGNPTSVDKIITPSDLLEDPSVDIDLDAIDKCKNRPINTTELGMCRVLSDFKGEVLNDEIINKIIDTFVND